jgi:hypothetical protein
MLTKVYFASLAVVAVAIVAVGNVRRRQSLCRVATGAAVLAVIPLALAGWWYWRAWRLTGSFTGEQAMASAARGSFRVAALHARWIHIADFAFLSHIWLGGWSFLVVRAWMYRAVAALLALSVAGLICRMRRLEPGVWIAISLEAAFWFGISLNAIANVMTGKSGTFGYYAFAILAAEIICIVAGFEAFGGAPGRVGTLATSTILSVIELFGMGFYALPYWSGMIVHDAAGRLHALDLHQLAHGGASMLFERAVWGKPDFVTPGLAATLGFCFVAAVMVNWFVCWRGIRLLE